MKRKGLFFIYGIILSGFVLLLSQKPEAESPSSIKITLLKTELLSDKNGIPVLVIEDANGIEADLVQNPNSVFGEGEVPQGEYKRIKLTLKNKIVYSGPNPCGGAPLQDQEVLIDTSKEKDDAVELYFATADDGGDTGWYANGSQEHPFFIQNPIKVEADKSTVVKLIFNTANTLQCIGQNPVLIPPTITILNYVEKPSLSTCSFPAEYWFTHFNISANIYQDGKRIEPTLANLFSRTTFVSGWGKVTFGAPDQNGVGSWYVYVGKKAEEGGMAEHRHNLSYWCKNETYCDDGYHNPANPEAGNLEFGGIYTITGNKAIMSMGEGSIEGYFSDDCSVFIGINISKDDENDTVLAVKKSQFPAGFPKEKFVMLSQRVEINYDQTSYKTTMLWTSNQLLLLDRAKFFEWVSRNHIYAEYNGDGSLKNWKINEPGEDFEENRSFSLPATIISQEGILQIPVEEFIAMGANDNGIVAGENVEINRWGHHGIDSSFMISINESPSISDLDGKWMLVMRESEVKPGGNGWGTGDESIWYGITYGIAEISNGNVLSKSFIHRDVFTGDMRSESGGGETIELVSECYEGGKPLTTSPCNGISLNVFKIKSTRGEIIGRAVLDKTGKVFVIWGPIDLNDTPEEYQEDKRGNPRHLIGVGVKIE